MCRLHVVSSCSLGVWPFPRASVRLWPCLCPGLSHTASELQILWALAKVVGSRSQGADVGKGQWDVVGLTRDRLPWLRLDRQVIMRGELTLVSLARGMRRRGTCYCRGLRTRKPGAGDTAAMPKGCVQDRAVVLLECGGGSGGRSREEGGPVSEWLRQDLTGPGQEGSR